MQYYVVTYTHTKLVRWAIYLYSHIKYLKDLVKQGKLQISGPGIGTPVRSAQLVFNVTDRKELDQLIADDPFSIKGLVASSTTNLWDVQYGTMTRPSSPDPKGTRYFRATYDLKGAKVPEDIEKKRQTYLQRLLKHRKIRAAGAYVNNPTAGLSIIAATEPAEAEALMREDPYVKELGADFEVIEWDPKFGSFR